ncbi:MAG TPA: hypothetical protein DCY13_05130 [Verrucomicrobiales bacterium]|nr:hypothetical protein [Verrucomicrobiales bacterium]
MQCDAIAMSEVQLVKAQPIARTRSLGASGKDCAPIRSKFGESSPSRWQSVFGRDSRSCEWGELSQRQALSALACVGLQPKITDKPLDCLRNRSYAVRTRLVEVLGRGLLETAAVDHTGRADRAIRLGPVVQAVAGKKLQSTVQRSTRT